MEKIKAYEIKHTNAVTRKFHGKKLNDDLNTISIGVRETQRQEL